MQDILSKFIRLARQYRYTLLAIVATLTINPVFASVSAEGHAGPAKTFFWIAIILLIAKMSGLVEKLGQPAVLGELIAGVVVGNFFCIGKGGVCQGEGGRSGDCTRHIGDTVMNHPVHHKNRVTVRGRPGGFRASTLINANIHKHGTIFHPSAVLHICPSWR